MATKTDRLMWDRLLAGVGPSISCGRGTAVYSKENKIVALLTLNADVYETLPLRSLSLGDRIEENGFLIDENGERVGRLDLFDKTVVTPTEAFTRAIEHIERRLRAEGWTESAV